MSRTRVSMDRIARDEPQIPLRSPKANPVALVVVLGIVVLIAAAFALYAESLAARVVWGSMAAMLVLVMVAAVRMQGDLSERVVRIDTRAKTLRFVAPALVPVLFWLAALSGSLLAVTAFVVGFDRVGRGFIFVGLVSVFWIGQQLWALRTPAGLALSEAGLRGVRGTKPIDVAWDDLSFAEVVTSPKGAQLVLHLRPAGAITVVPHYTGSDPNVLAPLINFFLAHPGHRAALATPMAALVLVEQQASASRKAD